jgi:lysozyme family protein
MTTFDEAFTRLLGHEGSYSNHASDPGGATMWGVTQAVARANGYTGDMRNFPVFEAKLIYRASYWDACRCDELPDAVRFDVFDGAVNSGVGQSIKWLQRSVGTADDGVIGMKTLLAATGLAGSVIAARYNGHRLEFMTDLKTWSAFGGGWARRIASNLKAK